MGGSHAGSQSEHAPLGRLAMRHAVSIHPRGVQSDRQRQRERHTDGEDQRLETGATAEASLRQGESDVRYLGVGGVARRRLPVDLLRRGI